MPDDTLTKETLAQACHAAANALSDARDMLAQAVGYSVLLDDEVTRSELEAALHQAQATFSIVSAHVPGDDEEE